MEKKIQRLINQYDAEVQMWEYTLEQSQKSKQELEDKTGQKLVDTHKPAIIARLHTYRQVIADLEHTLNNK